MTYTLTQHDNYNSVGGGPYTWTFPGASTAGEFLTMAVGLESFNTAKPAAPSGWTMQPVFSTTNQFGGNYWILLYTYPNNPGGITSFVLPSASSTYADGSGVFGEFPGVSSAGTVDQSGHTDNPSATSVSSQTVTASGSNAFAGDLVLAYATVGGFATPETASVSSSTPAGMATIDAQSAGASAHPVLAGFYGTSGAAGETDTVSWSFNHSDAWSSLIYNFQSASIAASNSGFFALMGM